MLSQIGSPEIIAVALIVFFFFGFKRLPDLIRGMKKAPNEFKKGLKEDEAPNA